MRHWLLAALIAVGTAACRRSRALPPETANYHPIPFADPVHLPAFLPDGLKDEDAAPEYAALLSATDAAERARLLDLALTKRRSSFGIRQSKPGMDAYFHAIAANDGLFLDISRTLTERIKDAQRRSDWPALEAESRRLTLLGWHGLQDWDTTLQALGGTFIVGGILREGVAADKLGKRDRAFKLASTEALLDVKACLPDSAVNSEIESDAADPAKIPALSRRLADPAGRRAYAGWALSLVALEWSPAEITAGRPDPARGRLLAQAAALGDPNLAILAANFAAAMKEIETELSAVPSVERAAALDRINQRFLLQFRTKS
jgi:hypothetical protein